MNEPRYKRPFDLAVLFIAHIGLAPVWLFLWLAIPLAIKLDDRGPVFYSQERIGKGGRTFTVRKFRSMVTNAEANTGAVWASREDPRITRVGRILRHTALDELPQVLNIWAGDMSFVGPRPERPELHRKFAEETAGFDLRLNARPGMAGMAQVYGHYDLSPQEKLDYDLRYIRSMNLFTDMKLMTLAVFNTVLARWDHATAVNPVNVSDSGPMADADQFTSLAQAKNIEDDADEEVHDEAGKAA